MSFLDKIPESEIKRIIELDGISFKDHLQSLKDERSMQNNEYASTKSKASRHTLSLPPRFYWWLTRKYGRHIWKDDKFVREIYDTWSCFRMAERY